MRSNSNASSNSKSKAISQLFAVAVLTGFGLMLSGAPNAIAQDGTAFPSLPSMPAMPSMPSLPSISPIAPAPAPPAPASPTVAPLPSAPAVRVHAKPVHPILPAHPSTPAAPAAPAVQAAPAAPAAPPAPELLSSVVYLEDEDAFAPEPAHRAHRSHRDGPATDCSDLHVQFDGEAGIMDSEERTLTKSEASTLRIDNIENGGIQMRGWDKDTYSITACKFADRERNDAKELLSQIKLSTSGGHVTVSGPGHEREWAVHLLIRTPRAATVDVRTHNGPLSMYEVDGKITARGTNGPISMSNCTGEADISAENGPISFSGKGGKLRLHTQNGPISIALQDSDWSQGGLEADAVNGPLSLSVPSGFKSSFVLESKGHSPMSCHASICGDARKTWDDDNRRIEYGSGTPVIHLSTENGPVTVSSL